VVSWAEHVGMGLRRAVGGVETFFVEAGEGRPVLLIHGWASSSFSWRRLLPLLAERFRAVAVDLPGFGLSKPLKGGFRLGPVSAHLSSLMQSLGHERYAVVGHSMGGLIASHLAASDPGVAGLALISPSFPSEGAGRPIYARLGENRALGGLLLRFLVRRWFIRRALRGACYRAEIVDAEMVEGYFRSVEGARDPLLAGLTLREEFSMDSLERIAVPALLVWGEADVWVPLRVGREVVGRTGWRLEVLPETGHLAQEERPAEVFRILEGFLGELSW
jgi:pimeloyl-ACP methyl ester carboxylesterase